MNRRFKMFKDHAESEAPMPAGEMTAILGRIYVVVLLVLVVGLANVNIGGLIDSMEVLQFGDPAATTNFTA
jgi:hypothetical protein